MKLGRYLSFNGRTTRLGYWRTLVVLNLSLAVVWCSGLLLSEATGNTLFGKVALALVILMQWLGVALAIRRLHDRNKSAWWLLVLYLAPLLGLAALDTKMADPLSSLALSLIVLVLGLWGFIEIGFLKGTKGANRFGPDPSVA